MYKEDKTKELLEGKNQTWYSFKDYILSHFNFTGGSKVAGDFHFKAKQFQVKVKRQKELQIDVTKNVVSTALTACKIKSAGMSFESLLSLVSMCGGDIGNIGHGR